MTSTERKRTTRQGDKTAREDRVAILDFETDPFDKLTGAKIYPFCAVFYSDDWPARIIWNEDFDAFVAEVMAGFDALPLDENGRGYTVYAHNGGKFDFMFLLHKLRGQVSFKGRSLMSAKIGAHEIRDSFHIIPEKLANLQKDAFDYQRMTKANRNKWRDEIIRYCVNDCKYLLGYVKQFVANYGLKISIGAAAITELRKSYDVKKLSAGMDAYLRNFFFGGRVECLGGRGHWAGDYKLYDVNSMYPSVMAGYDHPIGNQYEIRVRGKLGPNTVFLDLECRNFGAFVRKDDGGATSANLRTGRFRVTIWEYLAAEKLGLIDRVKILVCVDCAERSNFSQFILPVYAIRQAHKAEVKRLGNAGLKDSVEYRDRSRDSTIYKLLMNNAYGKFAQNPRRYKDHYITELGERPTDDTYGELPAHETASYAVWERPSPRQHFNNVGTAASITGAARSVLMTAIMASEDPIYCDTDSLICRRLDANLDPEELGCWDLEQEFSEVIVAGKKLYGGRPKLGPSGQPGKDKIRSKGADDLTWADLQSLLRGDVVHNVNRGITMSRRHASDVQTYLERDIRATAPHGPSAIRERLETLIRST